MSQVSYNYSHVNVYSNIHSYCTSTPLSYDLDGGDNGGNCGGSSATAAAGATAAVVATVIVILMLITAAVIAVFLFFRWRSVLILMRCDGFIHCRKRKSSQLYKVSTRPKRPPPPPAAYARTHSGRRVTGPGKTVGETLYTNRIYFKSGMYTHTHSFI